MKRLACGALAVVLLAGCGTSVGPSNPVRQDEGVEARWGEVTFTSTLEKPRMHHGAPSLPAPSLLVTGTPKLGEPVTESYVDLHVDGKLLGPRYLFLGTDGNLYASREIDQSGTKWYAHPAGTAYYRVGTYQRPAKLTDGVPITFKVANGAKLVRHRQFAGIRWSTWISLELGQASVVQSPPLIEPGTVGQRADG